MEIESKSGMTSSFIILAAGRGTRMNSDLPKVLHPLAGVPILWHAMATAQAFDPEQCVVVTGHGGEKVTKSAQEFDEEVATAKQTEQLGTAHAVAQAERALESAEGGVFVLYGDTPFISVETLESMAQARASGADVVVLGFEAQDPGRYGRLLTEGDRLERIVEAKDATPTELAISICNSGVVCADKELLFGLISKVGNENASGEYYLTDIVEIANAAGKSCRVVRCDEAETLGINSRLELAAAEEQFQSAMRLKMLEAGVTLQQPDTTYFSFDTVIGRDTVVGPNVVFGPGVTVESDVEIRAFCHLEGCHVGHQSKIGPFARLRPDAVLEKEVHIGNFVEIKKSEIGEGAKVNHLSYIGDADIGAGSNIGAGTITCNYDGVFKHRTSIGEKVFVGSNTMLIAPVSIGDEAVTATGAILDKDVPAEALAIGRVKPDLKPGLGKKLMDMKRKQKSAEGK